MESHNSGNVLAPLVYEGEIINARNEMLSLTDMWRAAKAANVKTGGDGRDLETKKPADWLALSSTTEFRDAVEASLIAGKSGIKTERGRTGSTLAHWQIALAYAKYLSPAFHMWCNTVVRERMEGKKASLAFPPDIAEKIERIFGIERMLSHKVTEIEKATSAIPVLVTQSIEAAIASDPRRAVLDYVSVRQLLDDAKALQKGRRALNRKVGFALRDRAAQDKGGMAAKCPHTGVWLFKRPFAERFMAEVGAPLVRSHNDAVMGQGVLKLVRPESRPEATK